jgi:hypothetical protein
VRWTWDDVDEVARRFTATVIWDAMVKFTGGNEYEDIPPGTLYSPMYSDDSSSDDSYVSTNYNEADTPVVNDSSVPSTMPSAALANLTGPDTPASSRPGPSGVSPVPASKRLRGWESDEDDDEA